jgi:glucose/arabinose dehydrogenase
MMVLPWALVSGFFLFGYKLIRIRFENGQPKAIEGFLAGFLIEGVQAHLARPCGIVEARYGSLLVRDDANGVIYRMACSNGDQARTASAATDR